MGEVTKEVLKDMETYGATYKYAIITGIFQVKLLSLTLDAKRASTDEEISELKKKIQDLHDQLEESVEL